MESLSHVRKACDRHLIAVTQATISKRSVILSVAKNLALFLIMMILPSCFTTKESSSEDLDISLETNPAQLDTTQPSSKVRYNPNETVNWQEFFSAPSEKERSALALQLANWDHPESATNLLTKGRKELILGRFAAAETSFRRALRIDEENPDVLLALIKLYLRKRELKRSFEFLSQLKELISSMPEKDTMLVFRYRYVLALTYLAQGERIKGHKVLSDLIGLDKSFSPAYSALAGSYISLNKYPVAEFIIKRALDRGKKTAALANILGVIAQHNGQTHKARDYFDEALSLNPTYAPALINRANSMIERGEYSAAELNLQKAITYAPDDLNGYISLGICLKKMGRLSAAETAFERAIAIDPTNPAARFNLGVLMVEERKKPNVAFRLFHEVLQTSPKNDEIKQLAQLYIDDIRESNSPAQ